jgi:hypothetical protein
MVVLTWDREGRDDPTSETIAGFLKIFGSDMDHDAVEIVSSIEDKGELMNQQ